MRKIIPLTQGKVTIVDDTDYKYLTQWKWLAKKDKRGRWYAAHVEKGRLIQMHRVIMAVVDPDFKVDHRDGDSLHNWRDNLRVCTNAENSRNRRINRNNTTGYKGVTLGKNKYWRARIKVNYRLIELGTFSTAIEAARAYDKAAVQYHGPFARLNFPK